VTGARCAKVKGIVCVRPPFDQGQNAGPPSGGAVGSNCTRVPASATNYRQCGYDLSLRAS
jgi:hypothetical protein